MTTRRGFITGLISLVAAPAIVRAGSLMPVKVVDWRDGFTPIGPLHLSDLARAQQLLHARMDAAYAIMRESFSQNLYSDNPPAAYRGVSLGFDGGWPFVERSAKIILQD